MSIHHPRDDDKRLALYFTFDISIIGVLGRGKSSTAQSPGGGSIARRNLPDIPGASHPFYFLLLHGSAARRGITIDRGGGKMDHTPWELRRLLLRLMLSLLCCYLLHFRPVPRGPAPVFVRTSTQRLLERVTNTTRKKSTSFSAGGEVLLRW